MDIFQWIWKWIQSLLEVQDTGLPNRAWWIKIHTQQPEYTYYFGPFETRGVALQKQAGFVEDLEVEGARVIRVRALFCQPSQLTIEGTQ